MFCKKCGNQIADNAKFCNMCGEPNVKASDPQDTIAVIPDPAPSAMPGSSNDPAGAADGFFQKEQPVYKPYEPAYQQPAGMPYQPHPMPDSNVTGGSGTMGKHSIPAVILFIMSLFMISSPFLKMFGDSDFSFSSFSYLNDFAKVSGKNIFSVSIEAFDKGGSQTILFFLSLWVNIIFEICALIFVLIAFFGLFSSKQNKAVKVLGNLRVSIGLSLFGFLISFGLMIASYMKYGKFSDIFSQVFYIFSYICLGVAILSFILAIIFAGKAKKDNAFNSAYQKPYEQPAPPYQPPYGY